MSNTWATILLDYHHGLRRLRSLEDAARWRSEVAYHLHREPTDAEMEEAARMMAAVETRHVTPLALCRAIREAAKRQPHDADNIQRLCGWCNGSGWIIYYPQLDGQKTIMAHDMVWRQRGMTAVPCVCDRGKAAADGEYGIGKHRDHIDRLSREAVRQMRAASEGSRDNE